jgi:hypothetical protein
MEVKTLKNLSKAIKEYSLIVEGMAKEYTEKELTVDIIRKDHPELNFMDDDEIEDIIKYANTARVYQSNLK